MKINDLLYSTGDMFLHIASLGELQAYLHGSTFDSTLKNKRSILSLLSWLWDHLSSQLKSPQFFSSCGRYAASEQQWKCVWPCVHRLIVPLDNNCKIVVAVTLCITIASSALSAMAWRLSRGMGIKQAFIPMKNCVPVVCVTNVEQIGQNCQKSHNC